MQTSKTPCTGKVDKFCNVCGNFQPQDSRRIINDSIKEQYEKCYKQPLKNFNKSWVPKSICTICRKNLSNWDEIEYEVVIEPSVWREPRNHHDDCYFCLCDFIGFNKKTKEKLSIPVLKV